MEPIMDDSIQSFVTYLAGAGVVGLICWTWALWLRHHDLDKKVAEFYPKRPELLEIQAQTNIRLARIEDLVYRLCMKLEVPVVHSDAYR